ncbi:hypothetical protein A3K64_00150 [Candidatus Micrarchaeota archaeon RBG_16_36_9]|nr:MAG: hypothetical protein A3K64_00150 [Candidatus Micrarchaeota archaeon RBG_16_36_9]
MPVKKEKECCHGMYKIFLGILLIIVAIVFSFTTNIKDAFMYSFLVVGILFILKGIYISYM